MAKYWVGLFLKQTIKLVWPYWRNWTMYIAPDIVHCRKSQNKSGRRVQHCMPLYINFVWCHYFFIWCGLQNHKHILWCLTRVWDFCRNFSKGGRSIKRHALDLTNVRGHVHERYRITGHGCGLLYNVNVYAAYGVWREKDSHEGGGVGEDSLPSLALCRKNRDSIPLLDFFLANCLLRYGSKCINVAGKSLKQI